MLLKQLKRKRKDGQLTHQPLDSTTPKTQGEFTFFAKNIMICKNLSTITSMLNA